MKKKVVYLLLSVFTLNMSSSNADNVVSKALTGAIDTVKGAGSSIKNAGSSAVHKVKDKTSAIIDTAKYDMKKMGSLVKSTVSGALSKAMTGLKSIAGLSKSALDIITAHKEDIGKVISTALMAGKGLAEVTTIVAGFIGDVCPKATITTDMISKVTTQLIKPVIEATQDTFEDQSSSSSYY